MGQSPINIGQCVIKRNSIIEAIRNGDIHQECIGFQCLKQIRNLHNRFFHPPPLYHWGEYRFLLFIGHGPTTEYVRLPFKRRCFGELGALTHMNFMATNLNPFSSKRLMILPTRPRWTPSGLTMMNVRSE